MQIVINIPDEQIKKSLEESKYIHEDEGEKGFVNIAMLYTNVQLEFVDVERKIDFYSCEYNILPKGHGRLIDADELLKKSYRIDDSATLSTRDVVNEEEIDSASTIIEADKQTPSYLWECERCGKLIQYMADFCHECAYELFGEPPKPFEPAQESEEV